LGEGGKEIWEEGSKCPTYIQKNTGLTLLYCLKHSIEPIIVNRIILGNIEPDPEMSTAGKDRGLKPLSAEGL